MKLRVLLAALALGACAPAWGATEKPSDNNSLLPGGNSKDPVSIEADKLLYLDKEQKAIYSGNVVVIQGPTKLTCSVMTLYLEKTADATPSPTPSTRPAAVASAQGDAGGAPSNDSSRVRHMDCAGPVTVLSKTQTATGDNGYYDKPQNKVWLVGHVTLSDGGNVTKGDKLTYDLGTGHATVENAGANGKSRVQSQFIPGSSDGGAVPKPKAGN